MKIGIVGLGWLGLPLAKSLLNKGHQVLGTTRTRPVELSHERFSHVLFDPLRKEHTVSDYFRDLDVIILAFTPSKAAYGAYAKDCRKVLEMISPACKVILISSTSIYPDGEGVYTEKDYPAGTFKRNHVSDGELIVISLLRERLTILRMSGLVGPGRYPVTAMVKSGKTYQAMERVNLIHLEDAIGLIEFVIRNGLWNKTINGCATKHPFKGPLYTNMAAKLGIDSPLFDVTVPLERIISNRYSLELGYQYLYPDPDDFPVA